MVLYFEPEVFLYIQYPVTSPSLFHVSLILLYPLFVAFIVAVPGTTLTLHVTFLPLAVVAVTVHSPTDFA